MENNLERGQDTTLNDKSMPCAAHYKEAPSPEQDSNRSSLQLQLITQSLLLLLPTKIKAPECVTALPSMINVMLM